MSSDLQLSIGLNLLNGQAGDEMTLENTAQGEEPKEIDRPNVQINDSVENGITMSQGNEAALTEHVDNIASSRSPAKANSESIDQIVDKTARPLDAIDLALLSESNSQTAESAETNDSAETKEVEARADSSSDCSSGSSSESDSESEIESESSSSESESDSNEPEDENINEKLQSDGEDDAVTGRPKTRNEVEEPVPQVPEGFEITPKMTLEPMGELLRIVERTAVIKAMLSGEYRILEENSILCFEDRSIIGVLFETFGRVEEPMYTVKFNTTEEADALKDRLGQKVCFVVQASKFVLTDQIKSIRATDASNWHDEELPIEDQEFSDDEKEQEFKQQRKKQKVIKKPNLKSDTDQQKPPVCKRFSGGGQPYRSHDHLAPSYVNPHQHSQNFNQYHVAYNPYAMMAGSGNQIYPGISYHGMYMTGFQGTPVRGYGMPVLGPPGMPEIPGMQPNVPSVRGMYGSPGLPNMSHLPNISNFAPAANISAPPFSLHPPNSNKPPGLAYDEDEYQP